MRRAAAWAPRAAPALLPLLAGAAALAWARSAPAPDPRLLTEVEAAARRPCAPVEVVGLRGSGDPLAEWSGAGADVEALVQALRSRLGGRTAVELYGLPYAQGPNPLGLPLSVPHEVPAAAAVLARYVQRRAAECGRGRLLVVGQSEGAAIAHWAYPEIAGQVAAVVLLGDPLRIPGAGYDEDLGARGLGQLAVWLALDPRSLRFGDRIPAGAGRVRSYCLPHDRVCAFSPLDLHRDAHLDYRLNPPATGTGEGVLDHAARFLEQALMGRS